MHLANRHIFTASYASVLSTENVSKPTSGTNLQIYGQKTYIACGCLFWDINRQTENVRASCFRRNINLCEGQGMTALNGKENNNFDELNPL